MTATHLDHPTLTAPPERSCFTCAHSPRHPAPAGCDALVMGNDGDPVHDGIVNYCEASGANAEQNPEPGWPLIRSLACPAWRSRVEWRTGETDYVRRDDTGAWWTEQGDDTTPAEVHVRNPGSGWRFQTGTKLVTVETP